MERVAFRVKSSEAKRKRGVRSEELGTSFVRPHSAFFLFAAVSVTAAAPSFFNCGRIDERNARPQLCLFPFAAVLMRKVARPHSAFFLFAAVSMSNLHGRNSVFFQLRPYWRGGSHGRISPFPLLRPYK